MTDDAPTRPTASEREVRQSPPTAAAAGGPAAEAPPAAAAPTLTPYLDLHGYGLIGNEHTAALVSRDGSVDWACLPRFDSPSVFARLLDRKQGGFFQVVPRETYTTYQQYVAATNILTTRFVLRRGLLLTVTDFMPMASTTAPSGSDPRIVRRLTARGGPIAVRVRAEPRFDYARKGPAWSVQGASAFAEASDDRLEFRAPWTWTVGDGGASTEGVVEPGSPRFLQVAWGAVPEGSLGPEQLLNVTDAFWRGWISPEDAPLRRVAARWHPWVERSELVLKLLSYADSGVFVAAPTTSLPEWPGGPRNWDYRFVWLRDAAFTAQVFLLLGHVREARAYVEWAFHRAESVGPGEELRSLYRVDGTTSPPEVELGALEGYLGSRPVRVGNDAANQRQLDVYGELLDAAALLEKVDPAFVRDRWASIERLAETTVRLWREPDFGIWEARNGPAHFVHSKLMSWVALDRATALARSLGRTEPVERWEAEARAVRAAILEHGYDPAVGAFTQTFGGSALDASALRVPLVGFLPPDDPRVLSTVDAVQRQLAEGPFVYRYRERDGLDGPEGSFLLCSFWLVECLAKSGKIDRAKANWHALLETAGPLLLFSEQYDPRAGLALGNYPQAFTHIGLLRAALALGLVASDE
ncbi:MAG TPA: glycoside hydrolase family 15 protein [Thermoplasmata archaeon]|nr:glycoside hydrolase family 15 protein [Thermoplasmata archaeon]